MRNYHIYPVVPSVITVGGLNCAEFVNIECDDNDSFTVTVNPIDLSGAFAFSVDNALNLPKNIKVYRLPKGHFDILVSPVIKNGVVSRRSVLFNNSRVCPTVLENGELWIDDLKFNLSACKPEPDFDSIVINNNLYLEISQHGYLGIVNEDFQIVGEVYGDKITRKGNIIESVRFFNDLAARAEINVYAIGKSSLMHKESYNVYLDGTPKRPHDKFLYPLAFLQAVLAKDYDEARFYLSSELNETLNNDDLAEFFPHVDIYPCSYYPDNCVVLLDKNDNGSLFKITYNDNSIDNIEDVS